MSASAPSAVQSVQDQVDLYRVFAYAFGQPSRDRFAWYSRRDFTASLAALWEELGCKERFPATQQFRSYEEYESAYIALFDVGAPEPPAPLVESVHHKAVPAQQIALDCVNFYEVLGLRHERSSYPPDHLVTQLEFLAAVRYARESALHAEQAASLARLERDFLERHLRNWLPAAVTRLEKLAPPCFPVLIRLLNAFLRRQAETLTPPETT